MVSRKERVRLGVTSQVASGKLWVTSAAELRRMSVRQARRVWKRYQASGDEGLVHRLRWCAGNRGFKASVKQAVLGLWNPTPQA
jgi:hypothetical protein